MIGAPPDATHVLQAEYYSSLTPDVTIGGPPSNEWTAGIKQVVDIAQPATNSPIKLGAPLLFPQITAPDQLRYNNIATQNTPDHDWKSGFNDNVATPEPDIYPPGYETAGLCAAIDPADKYWVNGHHTCDNRDHVYYFNGDMTIGRPGSTTTIHGQILFVAAGTIYLNGNVRMADSINPAEPLPGVGFASSSTAHQAVFIPGPNKNVVINNTFYDTAACGLQKLYVEGLVLAPTGTLEMRSYAPQNVCGVSNYLINEKIELNFKGSMILGMSPSIANVISDGDKRKYQYLTSLKDNPPPYLPALSVILNEFQEVTLSN
jgi:hypothetical protein